MRVFNIAAGRAVPNVEDNYDDSDRRHRKM